MKEFINRYLTEDILYSLEPKDFGKLMGILVENGYIQDMINEFTDVEIIDEERDGNKSGYDLKTKNGLRLQVKFRQVDGKTLFSRQSHFENTRRKSELNMGDASTTGHVAYGVNEFDAVLVVLCPHSGKYGKESRHPDNWRISCVCVKDLVNKEHPMFCETKIKSKLLENGKEWDKILMELDKGV